MSKYIILAGMIFNLASGILFFQVEANPAFQPFILPLISFGVIFTVGGTVSLLLRADF